MILEEETYKRFGYYPKDLKPKSHKRILAACDDCGKIRESRKSSYRVLCGSCVKKGDMGPNWRGGLITRTCQVCGKEFNINPSLIKKGKGRYCSLKCMGIATSTNARGANSRNWKGGISFEPYCHKFNNEFKEYIRNKFDRTCFLCGNTEEANGKRLSVHHCNYDKNCGCADTEEDRKSDDNACQFVPLCCSCNSKVNGDRDKWEKYFKNKLRNKLNGWYI